jgi:ABC-2 type transport system ATP-binding protein
MNILEAKDLTKKYGAFTAVNNLNFFVVEGEIFGFLGPNGAGKTTTINMLTGLARVTAGSIFLSGEEYTHDTKKAQGLMGIVPDESNLYDELDGFENLTFCAALYGMEKGRREERARQLLQQFDLDGAGKRLFKSYSKGMKRKLTIAAGIIHEPKILFLDEPTTGIDVTSARQIRSLILELNKKGTTIFLTTHYIEEAERLCHRVAFIVEGEIVCSGTPEELMKELEEGTTVQFMLDGDIHRLKQAVVERFPDFKIEIVGENGIRINSPTLISLAPFVKFFEENNLLVFEAKLIRPSLEEVFVSVTGIGAEKMRKEKEKKGMGGRN